MPLAIMQVYDRIIPRQAVETLTLLVIVIVFTVVAEAIFRIARNHVVSWSATVLAHPSRSSQAGHGRAFLVPGS